MASPVRVSLSAPELRALVTGLLSGAVGDGEDLFDDPARQGQFLRARDKLVGAAERLRRAERSAR